jgi:hypothetical protein
MSSFSNFLIKIGVNAGSVELIGGRLVGPLAWANSSNFGGYVNPSLIDGCTFKSSFWVWLNKLLNLIRNNQFQMKSKGI